MRKLSKSNYIIFLLILFNAICAGIYTIIPISGIGFASYMILFLFLLILEIDNNLLIKSFSLPYLFAFCWLFILLIIKHKGTFFGLYSWFLGGLITMSFFYIEDVDEQIFLFIFLTFVSAILFSLFEMFTGFHLPISRFLKDSVSSRSYFGLHIPSFYFTNENDFSAYLVLSFCFLRSFRYKKRILYDIFLLPLLLFVIIIAKARLCILGIFIYYFFFFLFRIDRKKRIICYFLFGFIFSIIFFKLVIPYITNLRNMQSTNSIIIRVNLLLLALNNIFIQKNYFGLGPASFPSIVGLDAGTGTIIDPHNWFMELGVEAGLPFLCLYIFFIIAYVRNEKNNYIKSLFIVFLFCNFCSSRFSGILWNWFYLAFFIKRYYNLKNNYLVI